MSALQWALLPYNVNYAGIVSGDFQYIWKMQGTSLAWLRANLRYTDKSMQQFYRNLPPITQRVLTGWLIFFAVVLIFAIGLPLMIPCYYALVYLALNEYIAIVAKRNVPIRKRSIWVVTLLTLPASLPVTYNGIIDMQPAFAGVSWREVLLGAFALYLIVLEIFKPNERSLEAIVYSLFGYFYIAWLLGYGITLRYTPDGVLGLCYLTLCMVMIIASDLGGYLVGRRFGKRKLTEVSPNKTVEGAIGGALFAALVFAVFWFLLELFFNLHINGWQGVSFWLLVVVSAQFGDLFESVLKRWAGVKDSGEGLPGHGGFLDRIDSTLLAVPMAYYFLSIVVMHP